MGGPLNVKHGPVVPRDNPRVREIGRLVHSYHSAESFLRGRQRRKLANNTVVEWLHPYHESAPTIGVLLHRTVIVNYYPDGRVVLNSGGWDTATTRQRIRELLPAGYYLQTDRGQWYVAGPNGVVRFVDMMTLHPDGRMTAQDGRELTPVRLTPGGRVSMRSNPPGKFDSLTDEALYALSGEGTDDDLGEVGGFGYYALMTGVDKHELMDAAMDDTARVEIKHEKFPMHVIIHEDDQGFVHVESFPSKAAAQRAWAKLQEEYDDFVAEQEGYDDDDD